MFCFDVESFVSLRATEGSAAIQDGAGDWIASSAAPPRNDERAAPGDDGEGVAGEDGEGAAGR